MILAVDIGNTTIGFCGLQRKDFPEYEIFFQFKIDNNPDVTAEGLETCIREKLQKEEPKKQLTDLEITGIGISSVVPTVTGRVCEALKNILGLEPYCITNKAELGLMLEVEEPEKVGVDRLCDAAFAAAAYGRNGSYQLRMNCGSDADALNFTNKDANSTFPGDTCDIVSGSVLMEEACGVVAGGAIITVDLGTSTTINVIDERNRFLGGSIMPGLETGFHALTAKAAQLKDMPLSEPEHFIGKNTKECMNVGVVAGMAGAVDGLVRRMEKELGRSANLVLTGGCAHLVSPLLEHQHITDAELLYKGIAYIYEVEQVRKAVEETRIAWSKGDALRDKDISVPENIVAIKDIPYWKPDTPMDIKKQSSLVLEMEKYQKDTGHKNDEVLTSAPDPWRTLDIYYPASLSDNSQKPVIVSMHGGGWFYGDKELYRPYTMFLASYGFAVVNFNYRLSPKHKYPCGFLDVCHAMDFLAANAENYGLDPERLYLVGDSVGAQLVTQYCIMAGNPVYRENFWNLLEKQGMTDEVMYNQNMTDEKSDKILSVDPDQSVGESDAAVKKSMESDMYSEAENPTDTGYDVSKLRTLQLPMPKKIALNCGVYDGNRVLETDREMGEWYLPMLRSDFHRETFLNLLSYMDQSFPESYIMISVNDGLRHHTEPMKKRLEELQLPHIYREFGQEDPADGHVFHVNLHSKAGKQCNEEEMDFFGRT